MKNKMFSLTPVPVLFFLVPLKPWFPVLGPIKNALNDVFRDIGTSLFDLVGAFFVGLLKPLLFIEEPGSLEALNTYYNSLIGLFVILLLLGMATYLLTIVSYPSAPKSSIFRLGERSLAAVVGLLALRPLFDGAVIITNGVGRYLLDDSFTIELLGSGLEQVAVAGGAEGLSIFAFGIFASFSTLITAGLFYIVLVMRMLVIYIAYALLPLLLVFWVVDVGIAKYASQVSSLVFKSVTILLIFGILISGILAAGDAIGGENAAQQMEKLNESNQSGGELQTVSENVTSQSDGTVRGGVFQEGSSESNVDEAGVLTKIFGYLGSMWLVIILTYSGMGIMVSTGSSGRRSGSGMSDNVGKNGGGSEYGGSSVVSETDEGGMVIQDSETGRGVYMGEDGQTSMFGDAGVSGDGSSIRGQSESGGGSVVGGTGGEGGMAAGLGEDAEEFESMSLSGKTAAAATKPRDWIGGGVEAVGSAAERAGADQVGGKIQQVGEGFKEHVTREGAAAAGYYGATFGGRFSVDDQSGPIHRQLGRGVEAAGRGAKGMARFVKGGATTYGQMFAEEDPVRSAQIGMNAMRRSPIGDPRRSNVTGELKDHLRPELGGDEEGEEMTTPHTENLIEDLAGKESYAFEESTSTTAEAGMVEQPPITQAVDVTDIHRRSDGVSDTPFHHLRQEELDHLRETLEDRHSEAAVESVYSTVNDVTNTDVIEESETARQSNERLAKEALDLEGSIRNGGTLAEEPSAEEIAVYQDLSDVSTELVRQSEGDKITTFRGLTSEQNNTKIVSSMLDNPYQDEIGVDFPTVSSFTPSPEQAQHHSDIIVSQNADVDDIALASDSLDMSNLTEGELQMKGGETHIDTDRIVVASGQEEAPTSFAETVRSIDEAGSLDSSEHQTMKSQVQKLYQNSETLATKAGSDRLKNWADEYSERDNIDTLQAAQVSAMVDDVSVSTDDDD